MKRRRLMKQQILEDRHLLAGDLAGQVFADVNGDGTFQVEEAEFGIGNVRVFADTNRDGVLTNQLDEVEKTGLPLEFGDGSSTINLDVDLPDRLVVDVDVSLKIDNFFNNSISLELRNPDRDLVTIINTSNVEADDLLLDDEATSEFVRLENISGPMKPTSPLSRFDGKGADGRWTLTVRQTNGFSTFSIDQFSLILTTTKDPFSFTGDDGVYEIPNVPAGAYPIIATSPDTWAVPAVKFTSNAVVQNDEITTVDFPTPPIPLSLSGRIWNDTNANQVADDGEEGLAEWTVYIDANENDVFDAEEVSVVTLADDPATETDEAGSYVFEDLPAGSYNIRHISPEGWTSYALINENTQADRYVIHSNERLATLRDNDSRRNRATLSERNIREFDYSVKDGLFYGLQNDELVSFSPDSPTVNVIGRFMFDVNDDFSVQPEGITVLPDGQLLVVGGGLLRVDPETALLQVISERAADEPFIRLVESSFDGKLYALTDGNNPFGINLVELNPATGETIRTVIAGVGNNVNSMDVLPNGQIVLASSTSNRYFSPDDGTLLRATSRSANNFDWTEGIASIPLTTWDDQLVNIESLPRRVDFGGYQPSDISGRVTLSQNDQATGLDDVRVYLDTNNNGEFDFGEPSAFSTTDDETTPSDEGGFYELPNLPPGQYVLRQVLPPTLDQQSPTDSITITLADGEAATDKDFVNVQGSSFNGRVYLDANGNGVQDEGESGLPDITVYLDLNNDQVFDEGEPSTNSAFDGQPEEAGSFVFGPLTSKEYALRQVVQNGWLSTQPEGATQTVIFPRDPSEPFVFGQVRGGTITGTVFYDVIGDGVRAPSDRPLLTTRVFIDSNGNGSFEEGELAAFTSDGSYRFDTLPAGTYPVSVETVAGYEATTNLTQPINLSLDQDVINVDFGMSPLPGSISGFRWLDTNKNGRRDANEAGLAGLEIYIDLDGDGQRDNGEPVTTTLADLDATPTIVESGFYQFTGIAPGTYIVRESANEAYLQTSPGNSATLSSAAGRIFVLNRSTQQIEELDSDGQTLNAFPLADDLGSAFRGNQFMTAGPDSLYYVNSDNFPSVLWELDPNTGNILDSDKLPNVDVDGIAYSNGNILVLDGRNELGVFDTTADEFEVRQVDHSFAGSSLGVLNASERIVHLQSNDQVVEIIDADGSRRNYSIELDTDFRGATSITTDGESIYALTRDGIQQLDAFGVIQNEIPLSSSTTYGTMAVGTARVPRPDFYEVDISPGEQLSNVNFGNSELPRFAASGTIWNDANGDGLRSEDEQGKAGSQVTFTPMHGGQLTSSIASNDSPLTPSEDEAGLFVVELLPGTYRISVSNNDIPQRLSNTFSDLATAGQTYQLAETAAGKLTIELRDLAQNKLQTIEIPQAPTFVGPQAIAVDGSRLIYVDGSDGLLTRIWRFDRSTGAVMDSAVIQTGVASVSAATFADGNLVLAGDSGQLVLVSESLSVLRRIDTEFEFIGGAAYDPNTETLVVSGIRNGKPRFGRGPLLGPLTVTDAPPALAASPITIVNGELLAVESPRSDSSAKLHRYDTQTLESLGEIDWSQTQEAFGLAGPTPLKNSKYLHVAADLAVEQLSLGVAGPSLAATDLNGDGRSDLADAKILRQAIVDDIFNPAYDLDRNGTLDRNDIDLITGPARFFGDANLNGQIDFADFLIISTNFGMEVPGGTIDGDFDLNGVVNFADFLITANCFGCNVVG